MLFEGDVENLILLKQVQKYCITRGNIIYDAKTLKKVRIMIVQLPET